ncbi:TetR/AcrR family transcriptional regulator [Mycobacterium sp. CVI_P3]|uniref:TetR/AcrR family transcriptional regulator n=1 Tax=Mycobacterium pinniadriaticum TaxID=2994102 RepID=A0ABT3SEE3_9MYCO|nr:TetR/AcrR family transcriptional regulator [Mycobacterium pinniadriaticum]MCX2930813.1 TetR/AcrR family transcriptional regulator [Mycobacterium pinniadriaticum]MCX2937237.1 TetR/AcrR family transcriptional regulator [Mycobacterium pinniadriaticum]
MAGKDWLSSRRAEVAADRILDAAGELFAHHDVASVGMNDIARSAGCSRATLYRYFENREVLHTAYVHREAYRLHEQMTELVRGIPDPRERLLAGLGASMKLVRESPALSSWFATTDSPIGAEMAEQSEVIQALTSGFLLSLRPDDPDVVHRRARWLVRVLTSLLIFPGRDADDERAMLEEFVVPMVCPSESAVEASSLRTDRDSSPG